MSGADSGNRNKIMSWIPLLLAAWVLVDVLIVAAFSVLNHRRARLDAGAKPRPRSPQISGRPTSRVVH